LEPEDVTIERDRPFEIGHRQGEMVEALDLRTGHAPRWRSVPARALVDAGGEVLVLAAVAAEDELAVAVGAFDEMLGAHFHIDSRVPQSAADPVADDPVRM